MKALVEQIYHERVDSKNKVKAERQQQVVGQ